MTPACPQLTSAERSASLALATLMAAQSLLGLLFPGAYRDIPWVKATWFGNDLVTLFIALPILLASVLLASRGSARARLVWLGALAYAGYNYAFYVLGAGLNVFFALYVLAFIVSAAALIIGLSGTDAESVAQGFSERTPARSIGGYYVFVAVGLSAVWLGTWAAYAFAARPTPVSTEVFQVVAALDLMLMVPPLATGGVLLWRRRPWGYVIASVSGVLASLYLLVLFVNSGLSIARGIVTAPGELPIWAPLFLLTVSATWVLLRALSPGEIARGGCA